MVEANHIDVVCWRSSSKDMLNKVPAFVNMSDMMAGKDHGCRLCGFCGLCERRFNAIEVRMTQIQVGPNPKEQQKQIHLFVPKKGEDIGSTPLHPTE